VLLNNFVCFGGFGPFGNPMDVWVSKTGEHWTQVSDSPWNAASSDEIKYDFDAIAVQGGRGGMRPSIFTFGGDRETFDFSDPTNYLRVDNDVWRFSPPERGRWTDGFEGGPELREDRVAGDARKGKQRVSLGASPNPFNPTTSITYEIEQPGRVQLEIFDTSGRRVRTLVDSEVTAGNHAVMWDARDDAGTHVASGLYVYRLSTASHTVSRSLILLK
jgi:hypothetical protein